MAEKSQASAETIDPRLLSYEDFHPFAELSEEKDNIFLTLHLPEFKKEQLHVTCVRASHILRIKGERPLADNKWRRFNQTYTVPKNCNLNKVQARWQNSFLTVIMPKENIVTLPTAAAAAAAAKDQEKTRKEADQKMKQEQAPPKATSSIIKMDAEKQVEDHQITQEPEDETLTQLPQPTLPSNDFMNKKAADTKSEAEKADQSVKELTKKETIGKESFSKEEKQKDIVDKPEKEAKAPEMDKEITGKKDDQSVVSKGSRDENLGELKRIKDAGMKAVKGVLAMEDKEDRQINLVGVGVAAVVLVGIAAYVAFKIRSKARK